jgi:hypothetical protein
MLLKQANAHSVADGADIKHGCEEYKEPDKIHERNQKNVVGLAGEPRMVAHICLLSAWLGLGRQNFARDKINRARQVSQYRIYCRERAPSPLSEHFDFYLLFYLVSAEFGLVRRYRSFASRHPPCGATLSGDDISVSNETFMWSRALK